MVAELADRAEGGGQFGLAISFHGGPCWGLVLKCYEIRTRQHKMSMINVIRPSKHYLPQDIMIFRQRS
jgi:hypothetical protein